MRAWIGIVAGAVFSLMWAGAWFTGRADREAQEQRAQLDAQMRQEQAVAAKKKAEEEAPRRIEEARAAVAEGKLDVALQKIEGLRTFALVVPADLGAVFARDRIAKAKAAAAEKRWADARTLAGEAKGSDTAVDGEADQLIAKASAALGKAAAAEKATADKDAAEKAAADRKARMVQASCAQVSRMFGSSSSLSELQKEEAWKGYSGKDFTWRLEFVEADNETLGSGFTVQFKCAKDSPSLVTDLLMNYPKSDKSFVMSLKKGYSYDIDGRLKHTSTMFGLTADPR